MDAARGEAGEAPACLTSSVASLWNPVVEPLTGRDRVDRLLNAFGWFLLVGTFLSPFAGVAWWLGSQFSETLGWVFLGLSLAPLAVGLAGFGAFFAYALARGALLLVAAATVSAALATYWLVAPSTRRRELRARIREVWLTFLARL